MVLVMVQVHGLLVNVRFQRVVRVWQPPGPRVPLQFLVPFQPPFIYKYRTHNLG